ncbi:MAG: serine/threonine-protein kinase, partial [Planctomycetota bacterium]|nr:serine/threonine-protein kinase [Planctomycetota bacterium]
MSEEFGILLGKVAVARQLLSQEQASYCFQLSQRQGQSFENTALSLGYLSQQQIQFLIGQIQQQQTVVDGPHTPSPQLPSYQLQTTALSPPSTFNPGSDSDARTVRLPPGSTSMPTPIHGPRPPQKAQTRSKGKGLNPGQNFDGYQVMSLLGQGGMGAVYKVEKQGKIFALKVITTENMKAEARFEREAGAAMSVSGHPNIVAIEGYTKFDDKPYLVMEFVDGKGLDEFISPGKPYDPQKTVELATKIASALAFVHKKGITHRDLKPANILIRNSDGEPLITDFGLAKLVDYETMTRTADWLGTPAYMSPEQAGMDHKEVDSTSDTWALGVILYELSTGRRPFQADEIYQLINLILEKNPEPPSSYNADIDPNLEIIILKTLNKDKKNRYADAHELARDIAKVGSNESVDAYVEGSIVELRRGVKKKVGKRSLKLALIALSLIIPVIALFVYLTFAYLDMEGEYIDVHVGTRNYRDAIEKIDRSALYEQCARGMTDQNLFPKAKNVLARYKEEIVNQRASLNETLALFDDPEEALVKLKKARALRKLDTQFEFYQCLIDPNRKPNANLKFSPLEQKIVAALQSYHHSTSEDGWTSTQEKFQDLCDRVDDKDNYDSSLALFGSAMCLVRLGKMNDANKHFDTLSTKKSLGSLGEEFYLFYKGDDAITKLLGGEEIKGVTTLAEFSRRLQSGNSDRRKLQWLAWNKRLEARYNEDKYRALRLDVRSKRWRVIERVSRKFPDVKLFKLDFDLSKALGEYYSKKYKNAVESKLPNRLSLQRNAVYYYLNAFLKDKTYKAPNGYHAPQLADLIS